MLYIFVLAVLIGGYSSYQTYFKKVDAISLTTKERNTNPNPAEEVQLEGGKSYKVDNKNFKAGFYDIRARKGNVRIGGVLLDKGDQQLGKPFYTNNSISVEGDGILQLTPAKFEKETLINGEYKLSNKSVIYKAGVEIESGTYTIQVYNKSKKPFYVFLDINNKNENSVQTFDIKNSDTYTFTIKKGEVLEILNWSEDETDLIISLKIVEK